MPSSTYIHSILYQPSSCSTKPHPGDRRHASHPAPRHHIMHRRPPEGFPMRPHRVYRFASFSRGGIPVRSQIAIGAIVHTHYSFICTVVCSYPIPHIRPQQAEEVTCVICSTLNAQRSTPPAHDDGCTSTRPTVPSLRAIYSTSEPVV